MTDRAYGRISLDTLRSGSITKQRERIEAFAGKDLTWYADESVSGAKVPFGERPQGAKLLADLVAGDRVLVTKIDRAARSVPDLLELVALVEERKCSIVFVDQNIDTSGPFGRFFLVLLAAIAELEAAIVGERRLESLASFKAQGRHAVGKAPFGFVSVEREDGRGLCIRPDPDTAPLVRKAVERVMAGDTQEEVRHLLSMSKTGFHKLLHNPRLAGMTPEGRYETYRDPDTRKQKSRLVDIGLVLANGEPMVDPNAAILSMPEWRALQDHLSKPEKTWGRQTGYGAALSCGVCGDRMYKLKSKMVNGQTGQTHDTYVCRRVKHQPGQGAPSVMVHRADTHLEDTFLAMFGERRAMASSWSDSADTQVEAVSVAEVALHEAQRRFAASLTDEEESEALVSMQKAKRALRAAEQLPSERVFSIVETGQTVAEVWEQADDGERCRLLTRAGRWVLQGGRASVDKRIRFESDDLTNELLTHQPGSELSVHDDAGGFIL